MDEQPLIFLKVAVKPQELPITCQSGEDRTGKSGRDSQSKVSFLALNQVHKIKSDAITAWKDN